MSPEPEVDSLLAWLRDAQAHLEQLAHLGIDEVPRLQARPGPRSVGAAQRDGDRDRGRAGRALQEPGHPPEQRAPRGRISRDVRARPQFGEEAPPAPAAPPAPTEPPAHPPRTGPTWAADAPTWEPAQAPARPSLGEVAARAREGLPPEVRGELVFGFGDPRAILMLILRMPGPQVAAAEKLEADAGGDLASRIVQRALEMEPGAVYVSHVVKRAVPGGGLPAVAERRLWRQVLLDQVRAIAPKAVVTFGDTAARALLGLRDPMDQLQGRWHDFEGIPVMTTWGVEEMLEDRKYKQPVYKDILSVKDRLANLGARR